MPLDFILLGSLAVSSYVLTYVLFQRASHRLHTLVTTMRKQPASASESVLMRWAFRGRGKSGQRLARLFSAFPPLMLLVSSVDIIFVFLAAIAFLKISTSVGTLVTVLLLAFPFYRAADAFEMYLMSRVAQQFEIDQLSSEDGTLLQIAQVTLTDAVKYFGKLSWVTLLILLMIYVVEPVSTRLLSRLYAPAGSGLLSFAALTLAVLACTLTTPRGSLTQAKSEPEQTRELGMPQAGDHLSYGTVASLNATRSRLMRKFRPSEPNETE